MNNHNIIKNLQDEIEYLSYDRAFGILTRQALELQCREISTHVSVIALDFNNIHDFNLHFGYVTVNNYIKAIFDELRKCGYNCFVGRLFSGDEIVLVMQNDVCQKILKLLIGECSKRGLSFKYVQEGLTDGFASIPLIDYYFDSLSAKLQSSSEFCEIK